MSNDLLLPVEVLQAYRDARRKTGLARRICDVIPMSTRTMEVPVRDFTTTGLIPEVPGEEMPFTPSQLTWGSVPLSASNYGVLCHVSSELWSDVDLLSWYASRAAYDMTLSIDRALVADPGGLIDSLGDAGKVPGTGTGQSEFTIQDFRDVISLLPPRYWENASIITHPTTFSQFLLPETNYRLLDTDFRKFLGFPTYLSDVMPNIDTAVPGDVLFLFGDFRASVLYGERKQIETKVSEELLFDSDAISMLFTERLAINVYRGGDAVNPSGYVGLTFS